MVTVLTILESVIWISQNDLSSGLCFAFHKQAWLADAGLPLFAYSGIKKKISKPQSTHLLWDSK